MERERLRGTLMLWPGVADEQLGTKAYYVRTGRFQDVSLHARCLMVRTKKGRA
ncbi:MAG: hypothetical protein HYW52_10835 [Gemmatimonadetes bacterium]|nr:hypothetical protein [Gemmatimonadota bacterium]MBI2401750.1 hypothetical protein [Gemmatimonadota bacterium]MBI2616144.1 hypothetical protein [Gemmatimonadota bacterium]